MARGLYRDKRVKRRPFVGTLGPEDGGTSEMRDWDRCVRQRVPGIEGRSEAEVRVLQGGRCPQQPRRAVSCPPRDRRQRGAPSCVVGF